MAVVRELEGQTSERRWSRTVAANWRGLFRELPERSVVHQRTKRRWRVLEGCRCWRRDRLLPAEDPRRLIDGTPVPVCAASRVGRPDGSSAGRQWLERGAQHPRAGTRRCAARHWWCSGFTLVLTASIDMLPDQAVLVPAAAGTRVRVQREAAIPLLAPGLVLIGDRTVGRHAAATWSDELDAAGVAVIAPPARRHAAEQNPTERAFLRDVRNRVETLIGLLKQEHGLEAHHARSWWGLQPRLAGVLAAFTFGPYLLNLQSI